MTISVVTLGCKVNQCESTAIISTLRSHGYQASEGLSVADAYILNTCSVTAEADKKSRQYIAKMRRLNPDCKIIAIGCSTQNNSSQFNKSNVIAIGGTRDKIYFTLNEINKLYCLSNYNTLSDIIVCGKNGDSFIEFIDDLRCFDSDSARTRAFIKIQDGCNRFCTYCIIPYLRGRSTSRSIGDIVRSCADIVAKEIVLTGIDISSYGKDIGVDLSELLVALSHISARKRLGSLECSAIDDRLLSVMATGEYCPHFHLSLQCGSDSVLIDMNRHYSTDYYYDKLCLIRKYFPNAGITTDIIAGFPTETDELFERSCEFIQDCAFSDIHVFPYSSRVGTTAAKKYKTLSPEIVNSRVDRLLAIKGRLREAFLLKNLGLTAPVYVEDREENYNVGYTPNYIKVYSDAPCGDIVQLKLKRLHADGVLGIR